MEGNSWLCDTHAPLPMPGFNPTSMATSFCGGFMGNRLNMCPTPHRSSELNELTGIKHLISIGFSVLDKTSWPSFPHTPSEANCEPCMTGNVSSPPCCLRAYVHILCGMPERHCCLLFKGLLRSMNVMFPSPLHSVTNSSLIAVV